MSDQPDLFLAPREDQERLVGTFRGPEGWHEGLLAGLEVWCGPHHGWRPLGDVVNPEVGVVVSWQGRMTVGISFDLGEGPARALKPGAEEEG